MKNIAWMVTALGTILAGFTTWAEHMLALDHHLVLRHGHIAGLNLTAAASLLALLGTVLIWSGRLRIGALVIFVAAIAGFFGAAQLWATAGALLFIGAVFSVSAPYWPRSNGR